MKKLAVALSVVCLVGVLATSDGLAQRGRGGPHGAPRGGPAVGPGGNPRAHAPGSGVPYHHPGASAASGHTAHPPGATRHPQPWTQRHAGLGWINPAQQPFTPAWYRNHPGAWRVQYPHADAFVAATAVGVARWLAVPYVPATTTEVAVAVPGVVVDSEEASQPTWIETPPPEAAAEAAGQYMTIGVVAIKPAGQTEATRVIHVAVGHDGTIRGSHYDLLSEDVQDIQGTVDKRNLQATWTIGPNGKVVFQAPINELTQPEGKVTLRFPDGNTATWQTVQVAQ